MKNTTTEFSFLQSACPTVACINLCVCVCVCVCPDISEIESYRSYSPQDDRRGHQSDLSSHSSNEKLRERPR